MIWWLPKSITEDLGRIEDKVDDARREQRELREKIEYIEKAIRELMGPR